jgi:hypothetical protein
MAGLQSSFRDEGRVRAMADYSIWPIVSDTRSGAASATNRGSDIKSTTALAEVDPDELAGRKQGADERNASHGQSEASVLIDGEVKQIVETEHDKVE